jgi:AcrR family transcriptional regulator
MARWEPNASERLAVAALDLFAERGYENTTVIDIAQRAGLTKSTFFRHFQDKREVLFGDGTMNGLLAEAIAAAPPTAAPLDVVAHALDAIGRRVFTAARRAFVARRRAVIAANPELQEREALKGLGLTASMTEALRRRGVPDLTACVAADLGALAVNIAYERWCDAPDGDDFSEVARRALDEVRAALPVSPGGGAIRAVTRRARSVRDDHEVDLRP